MTAGELYLQTKTRMKKIGRREKSKKKKVAEIKSIARQVVAMADELKWTAYWQTNIQIPDYGNTGGNISGDDLMSYLAQGTGYNDTSGSYYFTGLSVNIQGIDIKGHLSLPALGVGGGGAATNLGCLVRLIVIIDNQASNNTVLQLYNSASAQDNIILYNDQIESQVWNTPPFKSMRQAKKGETRFTILHDKTHKLSLDGGSPPVVNFRIKKRFPKGMKFQFYPSATGDGYYNKRLYFIYVTQNNQGYNASTVARITYTSHVYFDDGQ